MSGRAVTIRWDCVRPFYLPPRDREPGFMRTGTPFVCGGRGSIEQGIARERALLCRLAARRFGDDPGRRLGARLADVKDPSLFDKVGDLILECATGEELLSGVNGMAAGDR